MDKKPDDLKNKKQKNSGNSKVQELEEKLSKTKYNKSSMHYFGQVKARIADLKRQEEQKKKGQKEGEGFAVRKTGDGTVVLLGYPSVGKSTLLNALTNTESAVGAYAFTTLTVIPGTLDYKQAKIQILDVPGIVEGAASGRGRGKEVLQVLHSCDLILIVIDPGSPKQYDSILSEIIQSNIRINQKAPDLKIVKTIRGGIDIGSTVKLTKIDKETITEILKQYKIVNAQVVLREDITPEQFMDVVDSNKKYVPAVIVLNKIDMYDSEYLKKITKELNADLLISGEKKINLEELRELIYKRLEIIRIYLKEQNKKPDLDEPLIMWKGATLKDVCNKLHKDFVNKFRFAKIWGKSVKYPGQVILKLEHEIADTDIIEFRLR